MRGVCLAGRPYLGSEQHEGLRMYTGIRLSLLLLVVMTAGIDGAAAQSTSNKPEASGMEADVTKIKAALLGNWESIAPEIRPSKNPDGSLKPFYLKRAFKYLLSDRFELDVVNSADPYGAVPLARIKIGGHMLWRGPIRSRLVHRRSTSLQTRHMRSLPSCRDLPMSSTRSRRLDTPLGRSTSPKVFSERLSFPSVSRRGRILWSTTSSISRATSYSGVPAILTAAALIRSRTAPPICRSRFSASSSRRATI